MSTEPLRVAAYCRVSTEREDQVNSLRSQQSYFRTYIESQTGWVLAEVYADEGLSGTSTRKREAFNRMVRDGEKGQFQLILTKEVSRFARNTVDALEYTRRLKRSGIGVRFINDNIDTRDNDGELRLTIMASMAQEESRKTSERVKWGQKRRMEAGVVFGNDSTFGYETREGALYLREREAEVVRHIYHKFLNEGKGTHVIARELYEEGIAPPRTATGKWSSVMVRRILHNEKYAGDLLQKKFVTTDFLTHRKVENRGLEEQIYLKDHHPAIVDRPTWEATQEELSRRSATQKDKSRYSNRYWCSGKVRCGDCASRFIPRRTKRPNGDIYLAWGCHDRVQYGNWKREGAGEQSRCKMRMVNDKTLRACVGYVLGRLALDADAIAAEVVEELRQVQEDQEGISDLRRLKARLAETAGKKERVMDAFFSGTISRAEMLQMKERYDREEQGLTGRLREREETEQIWPEQRELTQWLGERLRDGEEVFREAVECILIEQEAIVIRMCGLPVEFRLSYHTRGTRAAYTTIIESCTLCPQAPEKT